MVATIYGAVWNDNVAIIDPPHNAPDVMDLLRSTQGAWSRETMTSQPMNTDFIKHPVAKGLNSCR